MSNAASGALHIEKHVRGSTAGFNTPTFVVDAPGGGGKRDGVCFPELDRGVRRVPELRLRSDVPRPQP